MITVGTTGVGLLVGVVFVYIGPEGWGPGAIGACPGLATK